MILAYTTAALVKNATRAPEINSLCVPRGILARDLYIPESIMMSTPTPIPAEVEHTTPARRHAQCDGDSGAGGGS